MDAESRETIPDAYNHAIQRIKKAGLRDTGFRRKLIELLVKESPRALSVEEIHAAPCTGNADLVTAYRNVDALTQIGLLKRHSDESGKALYKLHTLEEPTLSITCRNCHSVQETPLEVHSTLEQLAHSYGYSSLTSRCEVIGYCENCARIQEKS